MRTEQEIIAEMDAEFARHPELADLNNNQSAVSLWNLIKRMWVYFIQLLESRWEALVALIESRIASARTGTEIWYAQQALLFQLGDALDAIDGRAGYAIVDPSKRIVTFSAASEDRVTGRIVLRAAKSSTPTSLIPLASWELDALKEYMQAVKYAGVPLDVVSLPPDEIKLVASARVDPQKITAVGTDVTDPNKYPVLDYIAEYLRSPGQTALASWTALTDHLQKKPGIRDFVVSETYMRRPGTTTWISVPNLFELPAGHAVLHADSVITYSV